MDTNDINNIKVERCSFCEGLGKVPRQVAIKSDIKEIWYVCRFCYGFGKIVVFVGIDNQELSPRKCTRCRGGGKICILGKNRVPGGFTPCPTCNGIGLVVPYNPDSD